MPWEPCKRQISVLGLGSQLVIRWLWSVSKWLRLLLRPRLQQQTLGAHLPLQSLQQVRPDSWMRLDLSPWFAPTICFVGACFALGKQAKAKAKQGQPKPKAAPLSDVGLAGKTIPEKVALARWGPTVQICNVYMCDICVFFLQHNSDSNCWLLRR